MAKLFGTDGVRGYANKDLTALLAFKIARATSTVIARTTLRKANILIGTDTRISADMLEAALVAGICSTGANASCLGLMPTPAVAYLTRLYEADAGIVISASHNSFEYNGIKIFNHQGYKLADEIEEEIEKLVFDDTDIGQPLAENIGRKIHIDNGNEDYLKYLLSLVEEDLSPLKVLLDCGNGALSYLGPSFFNALGCKTIVINNTPNGININKKSGSTDLRQISQAVKEEKADIGFAFDGDGDRLLAVDDMGQTMDGDLILALLIHDLKKRNGLVNNAIVGTVMTNMGLEAFARKEGVKLVRSKVGDRYVLEEMLKSGYILGGEQSGHTIILPFNTTGDGLITALRLGQILVREKEKASTIREIYKSYPQVLINARVRNSKKHKFLEEEDIRAMCQSLEEEFQDKGRVIIRASGTEPLVRVMIEGEDEDYITKKANLLVALIESRLS